MAIRRNKTRYGIRTMRSGGALGLNGGEQAEDPTPQTEDVGEYTHIPEYIEYPEPTLANFDPIKAATYKIVDPQEFASKYGQFNREEILKNLDLAKQIGMFELDAELEGLRKYAPAAAALKRGQISIDNIFNQAQRTTQLQAAMPEVFGQLSRQAQRAEDYASGRLPATINDRALELGIRSRAVDMASAGGFGATSSVARKVSDLLSAEQRVQLSQYGDQLLGRNIEQTAATLLAPTEYSAAGSEIRVMPEVGAGRLTAGALSEVNQLTTIPTTSALTATIQQKQFNRQLLQRTREFNASNLFAESQFNAGVKNQFALGKFGYDVGYAGMVAGAENREEDIALGLEQQQQYQNTFGQYASQAQQASQAGAISSGITSAITQIPAILDGLNTLFNGSQGGTPTPGTGEGQATFSPTGDVEFSPGQTPPDFTATTPGAIETPSINTDTGEVTIPPFQYDATAGGGGYSAPSDTYDMQTETATDVGNVSFRSVDLEGNSYFRAAGLSNIQQPNYVPIGNNYRGQPVFSNASYAANPDPNFGADRGLAAGRVLSDFDVFTPGEAERFNGTIETARSPELIQSLNEKQVNGDAKGFINTILGTYHGTTLDNVKSAQNTQEALGSATGAYKLYQNWPDLSPAQKSMAAAAFGVKAFKFDDGSSLATKTIPSTTTSKAYPSMKLGEAIDLFRQGYNAFGVTKNWEQLQDIQAVVGGKKSGQAVAQTMRQMGMEGYGPNNAAVNITAQELSSSGWSPVPQFGVGAIINAAGTAVPRGYTRVASLNNKSVAIPQANAHTAAVPRMAQLSSSSPVSDAISRAKAGYGYGMQGYGVYQSFANRRPIPGTLQGLQVLAQLAVKNHEALGLSSAQVQNFSLLGKSASAGLSAFGAYSTGKAAMDAWQRGNKAEAAVFAGQSALYGATAVKTGASALGTNLSLGGFSGAELGGAGLAVGGAYTTFRGVGSGNALNGAVGGSMLGGGLYMMGMVNPWAAAGIAAVCLLSNAIKGGGKSAAQQGRDQIRGAWKEVGFVDDNYQVTLADGSQFNIGVDGKEGKHSAAHPELLSPEQRAGGEDDRSGANKLNAWDVDYTNDLDYAASMGAISLSRLMSGNKEVNTDQLGNQLANAAIGNIGYGQEMTQANFDKMASNLRGFYSRVGIKSKEDMYQLINTQYAQGMMNDVDASTAYRAADMMFDKDGYALAQKLMAGRQNGINAAEAKNEAEASPSVKPPAQIPAGSEIAQTIAAAQQPAVPQTGTINSTYTPPPKYGNIVPYLRQTPQQFKTRNAYRYGVAA